MADAKTVTGGNPLGPEDVDRLRRLLKAVGERRAVELTGISRATLARLAAGLGVRSATATVASQQLARLNLDELAR